MERSLAVVLTCLLGVELGLVLPPAFSVTPSKNDPRPPELIDCVFRNRINCTCRWKPGDTAATHYTLEVERQDYSTGGESRTQRLFTCTTPKTSCTVNITNHDVRFNFCVSVTAHSHSRDITSKPRCQSGRIEVMLDQVPSIKVKPNTWQPRCLDVTWQRTVLYFPVSDPDIKAGDLESQIEFKEEGQQDVQVKEVSVRDYTFQVCQLRPDTSYTLRLRHRYMGPQSPWSLWSSSCSGQTAEDAPSAAPAFWSRVKHTGSNGQRLVSLLWKHLPHFLANGRVLFYNVTCQTEEAQGLNDDGSCRNLQNTTTSCSLQLPPGPCSCRLTASTSAGISPEALIWFRGAFDTELPPPSEITVSPLDDNSLDVRWKPPVGRSASGFVVEWFAVREKSSSIHRWEMRNSSCTALIITEGIKPFERYAVSVKALYDDRWAGKNKTHHIYTREGVPSKGPDIHVKHIFGSTVELFWTPLPVELLHGFIRNYTVSYTAENQTPRRVIVPGNADTYTVDLLPGNYNISLRANTDAGDGVPGQENSVHVGEGSQESWVVMYALLTLLLTSLVLVLIACLAQSGIVKQKLCRDVPDPSDSSLANWTPRTALEGVKRPTLAEKTEIKYSEVVLLAESEPQNSEPDEDLTYQSACDLQTYSSHSYSPFPVSDAQTTQCTRRLEKNDIKSPIRAKATSNTDLSSCPVIYSNNFFSQAPKGPAKPAICSSDLRSNSWQHSTVSVNDIKRQLGGDSELSASLPGRSAITSYAPPSQANELKPLPYFLGQHQSPVSFSDFSSISHSSVLLSHPAGVTSPQNPFSQSLYNSVPSLQPQSTLSETVTTSLSPFPQTLFVDFSYCPLQCDPYTPAAVD